MPTGSPSSIRASLVRFATVTAIGAGAVLSGIATSAPAHAVTSEASSYLSLLNAERTSHGLRPLTMRDDLTAVAQRWADHMASTGLLAHNPNLATQISNWQTVGENVGEGPSVPTLDTAFWESPGHRANILDSSYREIGIGSTWANGILWITIDFRKPMVTASSGTVATKRATIHHRTLRVGMRGGDVRRVQRRLHLHADGVFGPHTKRAVARFQRHHHLRGTGVVTAGTWKALHL